MCLCLKHYEEKTPANSACCFPKRSDSDKCSGCLVICPQRLETVFETISPPKTSSSKICHGHLKTAENDDRIIGNKYYSSARKVSSREDFIAWVIPLSFPSQLRAELHRFPGCYCHCYCYCQRQHSQREAKVPPTDTRDWGELLKKLEALEQENKHLKENNSQLNDQIKGVCVSKSLKRLLFPQF